MIEPVIAKIFQSIITIPQPVYWLLGAILFLGYGVLACLVGFSVGWMCLRILSSFSIASRIFTTSLIRSCSFGRTSVPIRLFAFAKAESGSAILEDRNSMMELLVFVYHPLNVLTFFPRGRSLFF